MGNARRFAEGLEERRRNRRFLDLVGDPEEWVVSAEEIERALRTKVCRHGRLEAGDCRECAVAALMGAQMESLALRLGVNADGARRIGRDSEERAHREAAEGVQ